MTAAVIACILTGAVGSGAPLTQAPISLAAAPNPTVLGKPVTLEATATSGATGRVIFYDGVAAIGTAPLINSRAALIVTSLPSGERRLRATFTGDSNSSASDSPVVSLHVAASPGYGLKQPELYAPGADLSDMVSADFNGDGIADLVALDWNAGIRVLLGNGDGTFRQVIGNSASHGYGLIATGDFNGDGKADLAIAHLAANDVEILLGNGDGTFQKIAAYPFPLRGPKCMVVADFDLDGRPDILIGRAADTLPTLLRGNGDGTFEVRDTAIFFSGPRPLTEESFSVDSLLVGDFNGDNIPDVIVFMAEMHGVHRPTVVSFLGNGDGTFRMAGSFDVLLDTYHFLQHVAAAGDFNGDGKVDIAVAPSDNTFQVMLGNGDGTFRLAGAFGGGNAACHSAALVIGDFNGDGKTDLACSLALTVSISFGNGDGTFQPAMAAIADTPSALPDLMIAGEFDGDGRTDLAGMFSTGPIVILLGDLQPDVALEGESPSAVTRGQSTTYGFSVGNAGLAPTGRVVKLVHHVWLGLRVASVDAPGWLCASVVNKDAALPSGWSGTPIGNNGDLIGDDVVFTCTRSDPLEPGARYPEVTFIADVSTLAPPRVFMAAVVSNGTTQFTANDTWVTPVGIPVSGAEAFPLIRSVVDGGTFKQRALSPREHFTIFADNTGGNAIATDEPAFELDGVSVRFCGVFARLFYVGSDQINAVVPAVSSVAQSCAVRVYVRKPGIQAISSPYSVVIADVSIALLTFRTADGAGPFPVVTTPDGFLVGPPTTRGAESTRPARPGDTITLWGTGCGNPSGLSDSENTPATASAMKNAPLVAVGGNPAAVLWAGLAPGWTGLCQFNVILPAQITSIDGFAPLTIGGETYPLAVLLQSLAAVPEIFRR